MESKQMNRLFHRIVSVCIACLGFISCEQEYLLGVQKIIVSPQEYTLQMGDTLQLSAEIVPSYVSLPQLYWHSQNDAIAIVSETGVVTPVKPSDNTLKIIASGGMRAGFCVLKVIPKIIKLKSVSFDFSSAAMAVGEQIILTPIFRPSNATNKAAMYSSSDRKVATVEYETGVVTAVGVGTAEISLKTEDQGLEAKITVNVRGFQSNLATANSFIIEQPGEYCFLPKRGHSEFLSGIDHVVTLWETVNTGTAPQRGALVSNAKIEDNRIWFTTTNLPGNAVIAAKDKSDSTLWSWHIWNVLAPVGTEKVGTALVMDRNLGALAKEGNLSAGLMYQWGRKDPFLGAIMLDNTSGIMQATMELNNSESSPESVDSTFTVNYTVGNPTEWIVAGTNGDWLFIQNDELWDEEKTIYDPCPDGYRVPDQEVWAGIKKFSFPIAGRLKQSGNVWESKPKSKGSYWYCGTNSTNGACLLVTSSATMSSATKRGFGCSVRCIKIQESE